MKNQTPRHRRYNAKELLATVKIIEYLKDKGALVPTPIDINNGEMADVIGLAMGTVKPEQIPAPEPPSDVDLSDLIDD